MYATRYRRSPAYAISGYANSGFSLLGTLNKTGNVPIT